VPVVSSPPQTQKEKRRLLVGLGQLKNAGLKVLVDATQKRYSLWVPHDRWREGCRFTRLEACRIRSKGVMAHQFDVWSHGQTAVILGAD
jgi:hypothetical protein